MSSLSHESGGHGFVPGWDEVVDRASRVIADAIRAHVTLACAESCTGGMVAAALTAVPGSSASFLGGIVSYAPRIKHDLLDVPLGIIDDPDVGVVSPECASAMADGVARATKANVAVCTTGIAGPTGAEPGKPVGTVYLGLCSVAHDGAKRVLATRLALVGDRDSIRLGATYAALGMLHEEIVKTWPSQSNAAHSHS